MSTKNKIFAVILIVVSLALWGLWEIERGRERDARRAQKEIAEIRSEVDIIKQQVRAIRIEVQMIDALRETYLPGTGWVRCI